MNPNNFTLGFVDISLYSASQEDKDIVSCFLDFYEINEVPNMIQKSDNDFLLIWQVSQTESQ